MRAAPPFALTPPRASRRWKPNREEDLLQCQAYDFLCRTLPRNAFAMHPANGGFRLPSEAKRLKGFGVLPGAADLLIVVEGKLYAIELKSAKGDVSPAQINFQAMCHRAGVPYAVARSLGEVEAALRRWNVPLAGRVAA